MTFFLWANIGQSDRLALWWSKSETSQHTNKLDHFQLGIHTPEQQTSLYDQKTKAQSLPIPKIPYLFNKVVYISIYRPQSSLPPVLIGTMQWYYSKGYAI